MMNPERQQLADNIRIAIAELTTEQEIFKSAAVMIDQFSENFNWTGFYMMRDGTLEVGPYIGPRTEHARISLDTGICGAAASQKKTIVVDDVRSDPRFLACSLSTRSEIVVPLMDGEACLGQIDIDSNRANNFTEDDRVMLETVADIIVRRLKEIC